MSRKGEGSFEVEMDKMKADNERLIMLLRASNDYQDMTDSDILKKATFNSNLGSSNKRGKSADPAANKSQYGPNL